MEINKHMQAFFAAYSFPIPGDSNKNKDGAELDLEGRITHSFIIACATYIPIINTIAAILLLKQSETFIETAEDRALFFKHIIMLTGLGIILLPVNIIATVTNVIFNKINKDDKFNREWDLKIV